MGHYISGKEAALADRYLNFKTLAAHEQVDVDYRIRVVSRDTPIAAIAPHGGWIEPGTSEIAEAIAGNDLSFYAFEGLRKGRPHRDLHITSSRFDEPQALHLIGGADTAIAIHGRANNGDLAIWLGGLNTALRDAIGACLEKAGFAVSLAGDDLAGLSPSNICNRGRSGAGVQLELPRSLRDQLARDEARMRSLAGGVREAILPQQIS